MKMKKFSVKIAAAVAVVLVAAWIGIIEIYKVPPRVFTNALWTPAEIDKDLKTVVLVDMGSNDSWPLEWRGPGSFLDEETDVNIVIVHFLDVTKELVDSHKPAAVILSGYKQPLSTYDFEKMEGLFSFLRETELPVLGICGGHQFIGKAYGSEIVPLGTVEKGFIEVELVAEDPILEGLSSPIRTYFWHELQVDPLPEDFILLGVGKTCRVQMMRHKTKPIYGVQFHPEYSSMRHGDGVVIFRNFLKIAGIAPGSD
ncbi:MAG: gamma-glutamyl-gamma-aminobutyrate hydrolase family protein [Deltaproteobacteria bacterium]|uniref:Gamma-glutamyl-gamma-aminobutyrate hydrolase family protein n=1 Tax=Candidatus Zymogenus saltonus TaxID=2844893 RepID=A0A9D8KGM4_9DELT|nr:gamma-glutamyl-gamma-aminobutyrate hydrolase family protein [Candidatus Zymogenus saltonus]